jgi:hypothetical protein
MERIKKIYPKGSDEFLYHQCSKCATIFNIQKLLINGKLSKENEDILRHWLNMSNLIPFEQGLNRQGFMCPCCNFQSDLRMPPEPFKIVHKIKRQEFKWDEELKDNLCKIMFKSNLLLLNAFEHMLKTEGALIQKNVMEDVSEFLDSKQHFEETK